MVKDGTIWESSSQNPKGHSKFRLSLDPRLPLEESRLAHRRGVTAGAGVLHGPEDGGGESSREKPEPSGERAECELDGWQEPGRGRMA